MGPCGMGGRMRRALAGCGLIVLAAAGVAAGASQPVSVGDARGDLGSGTLDLVRVSFGLAPDGKLRASITMARSFRVEDLVAKSGPPGTVCMRLWLPGHLPSATIPDYLVCAHAAASGGHLLASVLKERPGDLPIRVANASVAHPTGRTVVMRFAQSALGTPASLRFGAETNRAGCSRLSCTDTAPDAPSTGLLTLRAAGGH